MNKAQPHHKAQRRAHNLQPQAAQFFMAENPSIQLVHVGPLGDATGAAAQARLADLAARHPGRMYCPREGLYVAGEDKALVMAAADFCLVPSRWGGWVAQRRLRAQHAA